MEPPAQPTDEAMARLWALPGSLITIPDQPWAGGDQMPCRARGAPGLLWENQGRACI